MQMNAAQWRLLWLAWALSHPMNGKDSLRHGRFICRFAQRSIDIRLAADVCVRAGRGESRLPPGRAGHDGDRDRRSRSLVLDNAGRRVALIACEFNRSRWRRLAVFWEGGFSGDHCSPISDTTVYIESSVAGADSRAHGNTQNAYALLAGGVCIVTATLPSRSAFPSGFLFCRRIVSLLLITRLARCSTLGQRRRVNDE